MDIDGITQSTVSEQRASTALLSWDQMDQGTSRVYELWKSGYEYILGSRWIGNKVDVDWSMYLPAFWPFRHLHDTRKGWLTTEKASSYESMFWVHWAPILTSRLALSMEFPIPVYIHVYNVQTSSPTYFLDPFNDHANHTLFPACWCFQEAPIRRRRLMGLCWQGWVTVSLFEFVSTAPLEKASAASANERGLSP